MSISDSHFRPVDTIASFKDNDVGCDGMFLGGDGNVYSANTRPDEVPPFTPSSGETSGARIFLVNGVLTTAESEARMCQSLADATGAEVVAIHNATSGDPIVDGLQCIGDKATAALHALGVPYRNEATETLRSVIEGAIDRHEPVNVFGHSQGALIVSSAMTELAQDRLQHDEDPEKTHADLSLVHAQTFGGAAWTYPQGPDYFHAFNASDPVSSLVGLGHPDFIHLLGDATVGRLAPEQFRSMIGETLERLSGLEPNVVIDDGTRVHQFDHPEPLFHRDGQFDVQAHSFQLYLDELRNDPAALGAIVGARGADDDHAPAPAPEHFLQGHAEIDDWSTPSDGRVPDYETHAAHATDVVDTSSVVSDDEDWSDESDGAWAYDEDDLDQDTGYASDGWGHDDAGQSAQEVGTVGSVLEHRYSGRIDDAAHDHDGWRGQSDFDDPVEP
jgi:PE-PPE domain